MCTIHATESGRHQGWVDKHPQSHIHAVEKLDGAHAPTASSRARTTCAATSPTSSACDEERVTVIPNGIDPTDLQPVDDLDALRVRFAEPYEPPHPARRPPRLREGLPARARRAARGHPQASAACASSSPARGTHEAELKKQAQRLGLLEHGTFVGWLGDDVLHSLYRIADLCVVPSLYEPFGLVALESMASGCPCIVADTGGLREVVPNAEVGLRFRGSDSKSLAGCSSACWPTTRCRPPGLRGAEHVLRFDWADVARQTAELYAGLLRRSRSGAGSGSGSGTTSSSLQRMRSGDSR